MKYAFMSFSCPDLSFDEMIDVAVKYGYDGVEPRIGSGHKHGLEVDSDKYFRDKCRAKAAEENVSICCLASSCKFATPDDRENALNELPRMIDLAADAGCPRIRVFGGGLPEEMERDEAIDQVSEALLQLADEAAGKDVTLCMETHDAWCNPHHVREVMEKVNHPGVAVNWDIMHPVRVEGKSMEESYKALAPWIRHVHFHDGQIASDGKPTLVPIGEGAIDHQAAVNLLKKGGYTEFLSGEWIGWEPYEKHLPRELARIKSYEASA